MSTRNMDTKTDAELQAVCHKLGIRPGNRDTMIARITHKNGLVPAPKKFIQKNVPKKSVPKNVSTWKAVKEILNSRVEEDCLGMFRDDDAYRAWVKHRMMVKNLPDFLLKTILNVYGHTDHDGLNTNKQLVCGRGQLMMETDDGL